MLGGAAIISRPFPPAFASAVPPDIGRYVYVPSATTDAISVVAIESNRIVGTLRSGVAPATAVLSRNAAMLVLADARNPTLCLVDVFAGTSRRVPLPMRVERLTVSADGTRVAAIGADSGAIAIIDLAAGRVMQTIMGPVGLRDAMFGRADSVLFCGADSLDGVAVIALETGRVAARVETGGCVRNLARMPDGRRLLAEVPDGIAVIGAEDGKPLARLTAATASIGMYPSALGNYLLVPSEARASLTVFRSAEAAGSVVLPGPASATGAYSAWLDSVAFLPSASERSVHVYDLDRMRPAQTLTLAGTPGRGVVTADTRRLYLPTSEPAHLLAIDGATRRVIATIDLAEPPLAALIAGGAGLCH